MDNKYGIILDSPLERYFEIDTSYYNDYRFDDDNNDSLLNLDNNYKTEYKDEYVFGDVLELYDNSSVVYLFEFGRYVYVSVNSSNMPKIVRISKDNILRGLGTLNSVDKDILLNNLKYMFDNNISIPKKGKSGLCKLLKK